MAGSTPTPRIDKLASEGIRFTNYTVESQCTPTRTALMTGRQSVRCGTYKVLMPGQGESGLAPWEYTIAELLSDAGYATSLWGKWHLGEVEGRLPTDQGFDEWWGYKNSVDEAGYTSYATFRELARTQGLESPKIWEGKKGQKSTAVSRAGPEGASLPGRTDRREGHRLHQAGRQGRQAVLHLRRALAPAPAGEGAPRFRSDRSLAARHVRGPDGRDGPPARADRGLRGRGGDRRQHDHRLLQRQRGRADQCRTFVSEDRAVRSAAGS